MSRSRVLMMLVSFLVPWASLPLPRLEVRATAQEPSSVDSPSDGAEVQEEVGFEDGFRRVVRPGAVILEEEYDLAGLLLPREEIHALLPRDAIPALTDPKLETLAEAGEWLSADDRVLAVTVGSESVAVPFRVLNWHEIANLTVGGEPLAATY
jgi:hypothetical protein